MDRDRETTIKEIFMRMTRTELVPSAFIGHIWLNSFRIEHSTASQQQGNLRQLLVFNIEKNRSR